MNTKSIKIKCMKLKLRVLGKHRDPYLFTQILNEEGISVGKNTIFYGPLTQTIDRERPWMIKIGDYCKITRGVTILSHDYSRSVLRRVYGDIVGEAGITSIGDNVFIGMNSTILMGAQIGDNVIIGAGSVVSGRIPSNTVAAGNPCKVIRTLEDHYKIRKERTLKEAILYYGSFKKEYERTPTIREMNCFFPLFLERDRETLESSGVNLNLNGDNREEIIEGFLNSKGTFNSYDAFKEYADNCLAEDKK